MTESGGEALGVARSELTRRLTAITAHDWENPTPCSEWNLRQLVNHVVGLHHRIARLVRDGSRDEYVATREDDWLGIDYLAAWQQGVRALDDVINTAQSLETLVAYRVPLSLRDVIRLVAFDTTIHTWDVSRAIGFEEQLDGGLVEFALGFIDRVRNDPGLSFFAPEKGQLPPGASSQARLLHLAGREGISLP